MESETKEFLLLQVNIKTRNSRGITMAMSPRLSLTE